MFLTILTPALDGSRAFYKRLGCSFAAEQHGRGPRHYSTVLDAVPLELYPPLASLGAERFFIGVTVDGDPDVVKRELIAHHGGHVPQPDIPTTASGIATLRDPSGLLVRLFPQS